MATFSLESRLRFTVRRLSEMGDESGAAAVAAQIETISKTWKGSKPGDLVRDMQKIRKGLAEIEAYLVLAIADKKAG